jgi:hypothetical protein
MNCCDCRPIVKLNEEGFRLRHILQVLFFLYMAVIIGKIIARDWDAILSNVICSFLLIISFLQANFLYTALLIFFSTANLFYALVFLGLRIQNKVSSIPDAFTDNVPLYWFAVIFTILSVVFFFFLIYYTFQAYKVFKYLYTTYGYSKDSYNI